MANLRALALAAMFDPPQLFPHDGRQSLPSGQLRFQFGEEALVFLRERFGILLLFLGADVAAGCEHETVLADPGDADGHAEAGNVAIGPGAVLLVVPPCGPGFAALDPFGWHWMGAVWR
jgi:hypothetical protein